MVVFNELINLRKLNKLLLKKENKMKQIKLILGLVLL